MNIGPGHPCFIIAEVSCSHVGSLRRAKQLIRDSAKAGADAVKFQMYGPWDMTLDVDHPAYRLKDTAWKGRRLWDLYEQARTPTGWFPELFELARSLGLVPFVSIFDPGHVSVTEALGMELYKIASCEVAWLDLVRAAAGTGKPVILSDGMASPKQLTAALEVVGDQAILLRCVSEYPAKPESYRLQNIRALAGTGVRVGLSDHTTGTHTAVAAVALGACVVEKHIMSDHYWPWNQTLDKGHSVTPAAFGEMVRQIREIEAALILPARMGQPGAAGSSFRRRLVFRLDLDAGTVVDAETDIAVVRCAEGWEPDWIDKIHGQTLRDDVERGDPVTAGVIAV